MKIWVNPATQVVQIDQQKGNENYSTKAMLIDISGRIISKHFLQEGSNTIDINGLHAGAYFVSVQDLNGKTYTQKIVKRS